MSSIAELTESVRWAVASNPTSIARFSRQANAYGLDNADFQLKMNAMAYNRSAELTSKP